MNNEITQKNNFVQYLLWGTLLFAFFLIYFPVWKNLISNWSASEEYSHGFLIVPLALYITWLKKDVLIKLPASPSIWGFFITSFSLILYILSSYAEISTLKSCSMVLLLGGSIVYLFGFRVFKEILFPWALLFFMIPIPQQIYSSLTMPLQLLVTKVSVLVSSVIGVPIYREGNVIHLPEKTLEVVNACSGLRSIIAVLTLSLVFGYFSLKSNTLRALLFIFGIPAAIISNLIRVTSIVFAFYYFKFDLTSGTIHTIFGLVIFMIALIIIYLIQRILTIWDK